MVIIGGGYATEIIQTIYSFDSIQIRMEITKLILGNHFCPKFVGKTKCCDLSGDSLFAGLMGLIFRDRRERGKIKSFVYRKMPPHSFGEINPCVVSESFLAVDQATLTQIAAKMTKVSFLLQSFFLFDRAMLFCLNSFYY